MKLDSERERYKTGDLGRWGWAQSQRAMCSGRRGFHGNTGKTIDHTYSFLNPSRLRPFCFPLEVWSVQRLAFTIRLKCTSQTCRRITCDSEDSRWEWRAAVLRSKNMSVKLEWSNYVLRYVFRPKFSATSNPLYFHALNIMFVCASTGDSSALLSEASRDHGPVRGLDLWYSAVQQW